MAGSTLNDASVKARGELYKEAERKGITDAAALHEALGLKCSSAIHEGKGSNTCHVLKAAITKMTAEGDSESGAWEKMTLQLQSWIRPPQGMSRQPPVGFANEDLPL